MLGIATEGYWCPPGAPTEQGGGGGALGGVPPAPEAQALIPEASPASLPGPTAIVAAKVQFPSMQTSPLGPPKSEVKPLQPVIGIVEAKEPTTEPTAECAVLNFGLGGLGAVIT